jgi:integrase
MTEFVTHMRILKRSEVTIAKRVELIERLRCFLGDTGLMAASTEQLREFQATYAHLAPASVDIYTRHLKAFYVWAAERGHIETDPAAALGTPRLSHGSPHPTRPEDLAMIFACTTGTLRTAYVLAAFAGLRCGEICRLRGEDIDRNPPATAFIHGKGGKDRTIPLLPPVLDELRGAPRRGWIITHEGKPYRPNELSIASSKHLLHKLGAETTLHSMRHFFGTEAVRLSHDILLVRDILGHASVDTTQIYTKSLGDAHVQLAGLGAGLLRPQRLRAV